MQILFPKIKMNFKEMVMKIFDQNRQMTLYAAGTTVALLGLGVVYKYTRQEKKLTRVGVVSQLLVHPMKSGKVVSVETAECLRMGLKYGELRDRHWLVITEDGHMVTGRQQPRLVLVSLSCEGGQLCLNGPQMEELKVPLHQPSNAVVDCRVFSIDVQGRDCGDDVSGWLTRYLESDKTVRLVHFEPHLKAQRPSEKDPLYPKDEKVAYPDAAPIMLMSEASVRDLNSRLDSDVTVFQFRPSIVVSDCEAFTEDTWDHIQIGKVEMKRVVGCGRCLFTTVDPETGVITRKEPLNTLKKSYPNPPHYMAWDSQTNEHTHTYGQFSVSISPIMCVFAGNRSTQRKPMQTKAEHANSTQKGLLAHIQDSKLNLLAMRRQCYPLSHCAAPL